MSWTRILYDVDADWESLPEKELQAMLCRAVACAMVAGPRAGLAELDRLAGHPRVSRGHVLPDMRAELLRRLGRNREAAAILLQAASKTESAVAREFLRRRGAELLSGRLNDGGRRLAC